MAAALSWAVPHADGGVICGRRKPLGTFRRRGVDRLNAVTARCLCDPGVRTDFGRLIAIRVSSGRRQHNWEFASYRQRRSTAQWRSRGLKARDS